MRSTARGRRAIEPMHGRASDSGAAHRDLAAAKLKRSVVAHGGNLLAMPRRTLLDEHYERYRAFGAVERNGGLQDGMMNVRSALA